MSMDGRTAVVTGAGSGLGRAIATALAARGAAVGVVDLSGERAGETAELIAGAGGRAAVYVADVSDSAQIDDAITRAVADLGPLEVMVNNAGVLDGYQNVDEIEEAIWRRVIDIDLTGVFIGGKRALQEMLPRGTGRIVNMASVAGLGGTAGGAAYVAAKHAVIGLTRQMAVTYASAGITVNCVCPGVIPTDLRQHTTDVLGDSMSNLAARGIARSEEAIREVIPAGVAGTPEDVAAAVCWLASDEAGYVTGHSLVVDGGFRAK